MSPYKSVHSRARGPNVGPGHLVFLSRYVILIPPRRLNFGIDFGFGLKKIYNINKNLLKTITITKFRIGGRGSKSTRVNVSVIISKNNDAPIFVDCTKKLYNLLQLYLNNPSNTIRFLKIPE